MVNTSSKKRPRESHSGSEESESENEYQVEAIVDKRMKGKRVQYFLKWKGYSHADNTWEFTTNLNCPELVKEFEDNYKKKTNEKTSTPKPTKRRTTNPKTKKAKLNDSNEVQQSEEEPTDNNTEKDIEINKTTAEANDDDDAPNSPILAATNEDESTVKSRLRSTSKTESIKEDIPEENKEPDEQQMDTSNIEEEEEKNDTSNIEVLDESSSIKENPSNETNNEPPINLRLRITPTSASSISLTLNDSDNNNNTNEKSANDDPIDISHDQDTTEIVNDDDELIDKIEGVKNDQDGIVFRIRLTGQTETKWIPAKIANRKYPQAVIAFWESHVEFT